MAMTPFLSTRGNDCKTMRTRHLQITSSPSLVLCDYLMMIDLLVMHGQIVTLFLWALCGICAKTSYMVRSRRYKNSQAGSTDF